MGKARNISRILSLAIGAPLGIGVMAGVAVVSSDATPLAGIIDDYFDDTDFGFESEEFKEAAASSDALCQELAKGGVAMLRNVNKTLPYASKKVNVFGWSSTDNGFLLSGIGSGSSTIRDDAAVTLLQAFQKKGWQTNTNLTKFYTDYDNTSFKGKFGTGNGSRMRLIEPGKEKYSQELIDECKAFSDQAVVVLSRVCGENVGEIPTQQNRSEYGVDKTRNYLHISQQEEEMLDLVTSNFAKVTVIINSSNTMELGFLEDYDVGACLNVGLMGQSGALAIPDILDGTVNPSGRAADTFAYDSSFYVPSYENREAKNNNIGYFEGIYIGYRFYETADAEGYWDDIDNEYGKGYDGVVQFPFGYGLSYTTFEWSLDSIKDEQGNVLASIDNVTDAGKEYTLSFSCTNTGEVAGKDVMQIYAETPYIRGEIEKPSTQLIDFVKSTTLQPGQTQTGLECTFSFYDFSSYDCYDRNSNGFKGYELDPGQYKITFNENSHSLKKMAQDKVNYLSVNLANGIKIDKDPVTGTPVTNQFTGDDAYAGMPLDGSKAFAAMPTYLSREDGFWDSWPNACGSANAAAASAKTYTNTSYDQTAMPATGVDAGLRIQDAEGNWDEDIVEEIGDNYDSDVLDELVDQVSAAELKKTVECSGFGTPAIPSVGKPECFDFDGPAGFNQNTTKADRDNSQWTAFPAEVLIGQSFDKNLAYQMGTSVATEGRATGLTGWYAPGVNLHRTPYSGRNYEYYSEDPVLSGKMAAEVCLGAKNHGLYAYIKHFTMAEEGPNPKDVNTWTTEQAFREVYLKPFEIAVKEGKTVGIMSGFNCIASIWAGSCYPQNVTILREEWGFRGTMITDWSSGDSVMNPTRGIRAGNDVWLNPGTGSGSPINMSDPTTVYCAKLATKNVLFTYINTYYTMKHYDTTQDEVQVNIGKQVQNEKKTAFRWRPVAFAAAGVLLAGAAAWIVLSWVVLPKKKA